MDEEKTDLLNKCIGQLIARFDGLTDEYSNGSRDAYRCVLGLIKDIEEESITQISDFE